MNFEVVRPLWDLMIYVLESDFMMTCLTSLFALAVLYFLLSLGG